MVLAAVTRQTCVCVYALYSYANIRFIRLYYYNTRAYTYTYIYILLLLLYCYKLLYVSVGVRVISAGTRVWRAGFPSAAVPRGLSAGNLLQSFGIKHSSRTKTESISNMYVRPIRSWIRNEPIQREYIKTIRVRAPAGLLVHLFSNSLARRPCTITDPNRGVWPGRCVLGRS